MTKPDAPLLPVAEVQESHAPITVTTAYPFVSGSPTRFDGPRHPEVLKKRETARRTELNITCDTCGVSLHRVRGHVYRASPKTHFKLCEQAMATHQKTTGCPGHKLDARKLDGALDVVAAMESQAVASDPAVEELAATLGVSREKAAEAVAAAAAGMLQPQSHGAWTPPEGAVAVEVISQGQSPVAEGTLGPDASEP